MIASAAVLTACWPSPPAISGIVIPAISMPSIFMPPAAESGGSVFPEWQSEFIEANAQEISQAAASDAADNSSATMEPAKMRLIIMPLSIVRQSVAALQLSAIWRGTSVFDNPVSQDLANQDIAISV